MKGNASIRTRLNQSGDIVVSLNNFFSCSLNLFKLFCLHMTSFIFFISSTLFTVFGILHQVTSTNTKRQHLGIFKLEICTHPLFPAFQHLSNQQMCISPALQEDETLSDPCLNEGNKLVFRNMCSLNSRKWDEVQLNTATQLSS